MCLVCSSASFFLLTSGYTGPILLRLGSESELGQREYAKEEKTTPLDSPPTSLVMDHPNRIKVLTRWLAIIVVP